MAAEVPGGVCAGEGAPGRPARVRVRWSAALEAAVVARVAEGRTLRQIEREPGMPVFSTIQRWLGKRPGFRAAVDAARAASGRRFAASGKGPASSYCRETAEVIFERLCAGEALDAICRDPDMPVRSTVYRWIRDVAEFRVEVALAREIQGDALGARALRIVDEATAKTARLAEVRLRHLRWHAGKLAPTRFGPLKAVAAWEAGVGGGGAEGAEGAGAGAAKAEPRSGVLGNAGGAVIGWSRQGKGPNARVLQTGSMRSFMIETGPDGRRRVRSEWWDPRTGKLVQEPPGPWDGPTVAESILALPPDERDARLARWGWSLAELEASAAREDARSRENAWLPAPEGTTLGAPGDWVCDPQAEADERAEADDWT